MPIAGLVVLYVPPPETPTFGVVTTTGMVKPVQPGALAVIVAVPGVSAVAL